MDINQVTREIIGAAIEVHRALGPGLLESAYEECLCRELGLSGRDFGTGKLCCCRVVGGEVAEDLFDRGLCLPSGTAMTNRDLDRVIETILKCKK